MALRKTKTAAKKPAKTTAKQAAKNSAQKAKSPDFRKFLSDRIARGLPVFFDGGMGTMIQASGVTDYAIPEDLNITHPEIIKSIYRNYLEAGSNVITANTFGANPLKLSTASYSCKEYVTAGITLMREAIAEKEKADRKAGIKGSAGTHFAAWDTGQIGRLLEPMGDLTFDEAYNAYKEAGVTAEKAGADLAIIETMSDLYEMKAAILAVKENTKLPIVASCTFQNTLRTLTGADVRTCVTYLEALGVDVLGFNCGGSLEEDAALARQFCLYAHKPVLVQPNAGLPIVKNGHAVYLVTPAQFASAQKANRLEGVSVLGGCCGTTPAHIRKMAQIIGAMKSDAATHQEKRPSKIKSVSAKAAAKSISTQAPSLTERLHTFDTCVCSYNRTVQIGGSAGPQIIGERINPTGKKKCKEALLAGDMNFVLGEAESQIHAGAQLLDVNVGLPGIDEDATMIRAVKTIQSAFNTPLQIDSSEPAVLEKALRYYNGKPLVNSVNGKKEVMDRVFPLIKHYGGSAVALCIDENGIAPTAEGRAAVARKIIKEAAKYGIEPRDILIDTLTLTVSSQQKEALETPRAIALLKKEFGSQGLRFVLGVSNISFGLPRRDIINSRFFAMALFAGLDACIINPLADTMMETYNAYRALAGFDENCLGFIEKYTGTVAQSAESAVTVAVTTLAAPSANGASSSSSSRPAPSLPADANADESALGEIICKGFKDQAAGAAKKLLDAGTDSVTIINKCIVPALDVVGYDFEKGTKFLPQLLLSAETVGKAFEVIKAHLAATGKTQKSLGTILVATVYGDIHDIGKNIARALLENYGYTVIDLGKNVAAETIVKTVIDNNIKLVGLSALMTTTVGNMEKTIRMLHDELAKKNRTCRIMAGGAVLTADYALQIGADYYAKDAMTSVAIAKEVFGEKQ
jgi:5-methyltetrahydrofolate--homocysteine methyltransferase